MARQTLSQRITKLENAFALILAARQEYPLYLDGEEELDEAMTYIDKALSHLRSNEVAV